MTRRPAPPSCSSPAATSRRRLLGRWTPCGGAPEFHRLEAWIAPIHHEDAEALLHAHLDVGGCRRKAAGNVEFLARGEHGLDRVFPGGPIEHALSGGVGGREDAAQRAGAGP